MHVSNMSVIKGYDRSADCLRLSVFQVHRGTVSGKCIGRVRPRGYTAAGSISTDLACTCSVAGAPSLSCLGRSELGCPALESFQCLGLPCKKGSELGRQCVPTLPGCASSSCSAESGEAWLDGHKHLESPLSFVCQPAQSFLQ